MASFARRRWRNVRQVACEMSSAAVYRIDVCNRSRSSAVKAVASMRYTCTVSAPQQGCRRTLVTVIAALGQRQVGFRSLCDGALDTKTATG